RLTGYARANSNLTQSWSLTSVGDWSSITTNGTSQTRTHGPTHELLTAGGQNVTTDVKGNITVLPSNLLTPASTLGLVYDFDNKMKSADVGNNSSVDVEYKYDALGRRVGRSGSSGSYAYVQADQQTLVDYGLGDAPSSPLYRYVYGSYIDEPVVRKGAGSGGTIYYYHRNQQYSITAITNSSAVVTERYAYQAYGEPTILDGSGSVISSSSINNRYTYTGREWDGTVGLYHFRARWMSGLTGRFLSRDPMGYYDGKGLYNCALLSPLAFVDPLGLYTISEPPPDRFEDWLNTKKDPFELPRPMRETRTRCEYRLLSMTIESSPLDCQAEFEIERTCVTITRDRYNPPNSPDGWHYFRPIVDLSSYEGAFSINPEYCGSCADEYIYVNGLPIHPNVPPVATDTLWRPNLPPNII
ncbi:MAG: RHS repeat-associated core domain-containing protein, partial [Pirellula sp.]